MQHEQFRSNPWFDYLSREKITIDEENGSAPTTPVAAGVIRAMPTKTKVVKAECNSTSAVKPEAADDDIEEIPLGVRGQELRGPSLL
jgi:hypothetical protein